MKITLLRHGETEHNAQGRWQGHDAGQLSEAGRSQAREVGRRLAMRSFNRVVTSDLHRAKETAELAGLAATPDQAWREIDVGAWAGREHAEVAQQDSDLLAAMRRGEDVRLGGGESLREFSERVDHAFSKLAASLGEDDHALVVTHGGVIWSRAASHWGLPFPNKVMSAVGNTAMTTFEYSFERWHISSYNDAGHLGPLAGVEPADLRSDERLITLVRHGQTDANVQQIWQGHSDWPLNEVGRTQARLLADWLGTRHPVVSSPLLRAAETAGRINGGTTPTHAGLKEMFMGAWENLTTEEIEAGWAELFNAMRSTESDFRRGGDGELASEVRTRIKAAVEEILSTHDDQHVTIVSHGSAIRSYVVSLFGDDYSLFRATGILPNTGLAHVVQGPKRARLHAYGVAPHLEWAPAE